MTIIMMMLVCSFPVYAEEATLGNKIEAKTEAVKDVILPILKKTEEIAGKIKEKAEDVEIVAQKARSFIEPFTKEDTVYAPYANAIMNVIYLVLAICALLKGKKVVKEIKEQNKIENQ